MVGAMYLGAALAAWLPIRGANHDVVEESSAAD